LAEGKKSYTLKRFMINIPSIWYEIDNVSMNLATTRVYPSMTTTRSLPYKWRCRRRGFM